jgi:hypothetical protein
MLRTSWNGIRTEREEKFIMGADTTTTPVATGIKLTDVAATKVASLLAQEDRDDLVLRVAVQPGGCSGLPALRVCLD